MRVIILAPHPDDGEFGAGGTINRYVREGHEVYYVVFSPCKASVPEGLDENVLYKEVEAATAELGIQPANVIKLDYPVRKLQEHRQDILEALVSIRKEIAPDLVFIPNGTDVHQDHQCIHDEGIRAFKHSTILGYELPWNNLTVTTNYHVKLDDIDVKAKVDALGKYASQQFRNYTSEEFVFGLARLRGTQINEKYAEAFEVIRIIER